LAESAVLAGLVVRVNGSTIPNIGAGHRMETEVLRISSEGRPVAIHFRTVRAQLQRDSQTEATATTLAIVMEFQTIAPEPAIAGRTASAIAIWDRLGLTTVEWEAAPTVTTAKTRGTTAIVAHRV
jgi:hypothetical protein